MKKKSIIFIALLTVILACQDDKQPGLTESTLEPISPNSVSFEPNLIFYQGNNIELKEVNNSDKAYTISQIQHSRDDIHFRAQRIPTELYLLNKGVDEAELQQALEETEGEQLFYFEFEELQKQDLIKKYFSENLDQSVSYLSFDIHSDFQIVTSKGDTIQSDYSLYERDFHVSPYERLLVSFSGVGQDEELRLIYQDRLFGKGAFNFAFASSNYLENNIKNPS